MLEKLVSEPEWIDALAGTPAWPLPRGPVVLVAPHPDDEVLAAGGLLAALAESGIPVTVVAVTDGDAAYRPDGDAELAAVRQREQAAALARLGVSAKQTVRLGFPDRWVSRHEAALADHLTAILRAAGPDAVLIAPWACDFHSDHEAAGRAAEFAAARTGHTLVRWLWWSWHRRSVAEVCALPLVKFALEPQWLERKLDALAEHRSQLGADAILPDELLQPARRPFEVFA